MPQAAFGNTALLRSSLGAALVACCIVLVALALYVLLRNRSLRGRVRTLENAMREARDRIETLAADLEAANREAARLKRVPTAEMLPMLQLAHELRSPLTSTQSALDMLLQGYATTSLEMQNEMLELARGRVEAMLARINDFLRLGVVRHAEQADDRLAHVDLADAMRKMAPEMQVRARWRAVELIIDAPESLPMIRGTHDDMGYLLGNLVGNAIKSTNPGGRVAVSLSATEDSVIGAVSDTGIGIPAEDIPRIFDEFYRAQDAKDMDAQGSGLGLAIVKRVVETYGGRLRVESTVGTGSTFSFRFPRVDAIERGNG